MAYRASFLTLTVEALDAKWHFDTPDTALISLSDFFSGEGVERLAEYKERGTYPPELRQITVAAFLEGCVGWEDVEGPDGAPLPFTPANARALDEATKEAVGDAYLGKAMELRQKKAASSSPPTDSTPLDSPEA